MKIFATEKDIDSFVNGKSALVATPEGNLVAEEILESRDLVYDNPEVVATESEGDFSFELNDIGELRISNKYEPTAFVLTGLAIEKLRRILWPTC